MAASSVLLQRIAEFLRSRKGTIATDAASGCREAEPVLRARGGAGADFPWQEKTVGMIEKAAAALQARASSGETSEGAAPEAPTGGLESIQVLLSEAWLVRNSFVRAMNRFQVEQTGKKVDYTALDMTEARAETVQEFDRQVSAALSLWITEATTKAAVPAGAVRDLYNGMRAIQGLLQIAADTLPANAKGHVAAAVQQLSRLAASTGELLEKGTEQEKTGAGFIPVKAAAAPVRAPAVEVAPLDVPSFVRHLAESARTVAQKKGVRLMPMCNPGPAILKTDAARLHRAATLLVDYAVAFTEQGEVSIVSGAGEAGEWVLEIRDSSAGVPPEQLHRLLQGVGHAPDDAATVGDATLGIALARDLAQLLGGRLEATSEPGEGNCFSLVLPLPS